MKRTKIVSLVFPFLAVLLSLLLCACGVDKAADSSAAQLVSSMETQDSHAVSQQGKTKSDTESVYSKPQESIPAEEPENVIEGEVSNSKPDSSAPEVKTVRNLPKVKSSKVDVSGLTLLRQTDLLAPDNSCTLTIFVYSSAKRDEYGTLLLDDSQEWSVVVQNDDGETFSLLNRIRLQLGVVKCKSFWDYDTNRMCILLINDLDAQISITQFIYDPTKAVFSKSILFQQDNISQLDSIELY